MNGCNWQEKSFSVAVDDRVTQICNDCKNPIASNKSIYKYNGVVVCYDCFNKKPNLNLKGIGEFYTTKDKLFDFVDENTTGKPVEIRTKGQWKKHLKNIGQHDDIKQSRSKSEIMNSIQKKSKFQPVPREERVKEMLNIYDGIRRSR